MKKTIDFHLRRPFILLPFLLIILTQVIAADNGESHRNITSMTATFRTEITVAVTGQFPPLEFYDLNGELQGVGVDLIRQFGDDAGVNIKFRQYAAYSAALKDVKAGEADMMITPATLSGISKDVKITRSFMLSPALIIIKDGSKTDIGLLQLSKLKAGVITEFPSAYFIQKHYPSIIAVLFDTPEPGFQALAEGNLDALIIDAAEYSYFVKKQEFSDLKIAGKCGFDMEYSITINPLKEDLWRNCDNYLVKLSAKDRLALIRKYMPSYEKTSWETKTVLILLILFFSISIVVISAIVVWNFTLKRKVDEKTMEIKSELAERKFAEERLRLSDEKNTAILNAIPDLMFQFDKNGIFINCSGNPELMIAPPEVFIGKHFNEILPPYITGKAEEGLKQLSTTGELYLFEYSLNLNGIEYEYEARMAKCGEDSILVMVRDVTDLKLSQRARQESEKLYFAVTNTLQEGLVIVDAEENIIYANPALGEIMGCHPNELPGCNLRDFMEPNDFTKVTIGTQERKSGKSNRYSLKLRNRQGEIRDVAISASPWMEENGEYLGAIGLVLDITKQLETMAALHSSEERYQRMAENIQDGITIVEKGKVVYLNQRACDIFGYPREELIKMTSINLAAPEEKEWLTKVFEQAKKTGKRLDKLEFWIVCKNGGRKYIQNRYSFKSNQESAEDRYVITSDLTESKLAEMTIIRTDKALKSVSNFAQSTLKEGVSQDSIQKLIRELGQAAEVDNILIYNYDIASENESYGALLYEWTKKGAAALSDNPAFKNVDGQMLELKQFKEALLRGEIVKGDMENLTAFRAGNEQLRGIQSFIVVPIFTGQKIWGSLALIWQGSRAAWSLMEEDALRTAANTMGAAYQREEAEKALKKSEEKYRELVEQLDQVVFTTDKDGNLVYVSSFIEKMAGYHPDDMLGQHFSKYIHPDDLPGLIESFRLTLAGDLHPYEYRIVSKDGHFINVYSSSHPIYEKGELIGLSGVVNDITKLKLYEDYLVLNESRLEALYSLSQMEQASTQDIAEFCLRQAIKLSGSVNGFFGLLDDEEAVLTLHSFSQDMMEKCSVIDNPVHFPIKDGGVWTQAVSQRKSVIINEYQRNLPYAKGFPEGHITLKNLLLVPIFSNNKIIALVAVANKEENYDETDARQLTLLGDGAWRYMQRRKAEETLKQSELKYRTLFESSLDAVYISSEDGYFIDINLAAEELFGYRREEMLGMEVKKIYSNPEDRQIFANTIRRKGFIKNHEVALRQKSGQVIHCLVTATVRKDVEKDRIFYQGIIRDVSELKKLESQLLQAQKMESIGRLAGGVAHDFNNLLTVITGNAEIMMMSMRGYDPMRDYLLEIQNAADRASALTRQLLAFGRKQTLQPRVVNLNQIIANMDKMLRRIIGEDISLLTIPQPDLWNVKVDPHQIEQVIVNLAVNARDAMPQGGKLTLETSNMMLDQDYCIKHHGAQPGNYIMLAISDTGCGIKKEILSQIFDPFFTTKDAGKGTGLGLSTVYGIVKQSGGNIYVYSELNQGTSFKIYLPMATEKEAEEVKIGYDPDTLPRGDETILIAEDDTAVRSMAARVLRLQGYKVIEAQSGGDAWLLADRHQGEIQLLLTDVIMPNMNGPEVAKLIKQKRPDMKVMYMSGYTPNAIVHDGILEPGIPYMQKPFRPKTLAQRVREVLDEKSSGKQQDTSGKQQV